MRPWLTMVVTRDVKAGFVLIGTCQKVVSRSKHEIVCLQCEIRVAH